MRDVKDCETVSGHMYRMSMMTFLLDDSSPDLDRVKCMELGGSILLIIDNDK